MAWPNRERASHPWHTLQAEKGACRKGTLKDFTQLSSTRQIVCAQVPPPAKRGHLVGPLAAAEDLYTSSNAATSSCSRTKQEERAGHSPTSRCC